LFVFHDVIEGPRAPAVKPGGRPRRAGGHVPGAGPLSRQPRRPVREITENKEGGSPLHRTYWGTGLHRVPCVEKHRVKE
jgi:hypothetical protein